MFAQMKHLAIVSSNVNEEGDFYRDVFGLKRSGLARAAGAVVVRASDCFNVSFKENIHGSPCAARPRRTPSTFASRTRR